MTLLYACIAPHAGDLIPETVGNIETVSTTRRAMLQMGEHLQALHPEVIVIANPHGFRVQNAMSISIAERAIADWSPDVKLEFEMDSALANAIADRATEKMYRLCAISTAQAADQTVLSRWIGVRWCRSTLWVIASRPSRSLFS